MVRAQGNRKGKAVTTTQKGLRSATTCSDAFPLVMLLLSEEVVGKKSSLFGRSWLTVTDSMRSESCEEWMGDAAGEDGDDTGGFNSSSDDSADELRINNKTNKLTKPSRHRVKYAPA